ncbi:MAG: hypothetical protein AAF927_08510 [Bacteroidota bacterium]
MAQIKGLEGLTDAQIQTELDRGAKFVVFEYCVSIIVMTFKRGTDIYFIKSDESALTKGMGWTLLTFFLGWWGIPWGPIYTIGSLYTNLSGGKDVTQEIVNAISTQAA